MTPTGYSRSVAPGNQSSTIAPVAQPVQLRPDIHTIIKASVTAGGLCRRHVEPHASLKLRCERKAKSVSSSIELAEAQKVIAGQSHTLLKRDNKVPAEVHLGPGANRFSHMAECSCPALSRTLHPNIRKQYEDEVISRALKAISAQSQPFCFNLAIFAAGMLFGEYSLLIRFLNELHRRGLKGKLHLAIIDGTYRQSINSFANAQVQRHKISQLWNQLQMERMALNDKLSGESDPTSRKFHIQLLRENSARCAAVAEKLKTFTWGAFFANGSTDKGLAIGDFARRLALFLTEGLDLEIDIFADSHDYEEFCRLRSSYKNHLLIGSDIGGNDAMKAMDSLSNTTRLPTADRVTLYKQTQSESYLRVD